MICLPNRKRALAVSSIRDFVRKRIGAPLTIIISPWRSSRTKVDMDLHDLSVCTAVWPDRGSGGRTRAFWPACRSSDYLNRLSRVCGAWLAIDSACVPNC